MTATGLLLQLTGRDVRALPYEERYEPGAAAPVSLPLAESPRARAARPRLRRQAVLRGILIHLPREGWVWYFRAVSGTTGYPRVRARDGRTLPVSMTGERRR